jgi:hypothetical protein
MTYHVYRVPGVPATFATRGEGEWRQLLAEQLPDAVAGSGLALKFILPAADEWKLKADIDNFCEPVFSALINRKGWLGGRRAKLMFWTAQKSVGAEPGLEVSAYTEQPNTPTPAGRIILDGTFSGVLPRRATDAATAEWAAGLIGSYSPTGADRFDLTLEFAEPGVNIGDIATGKVKSLIDCLHPVIGGTAKAPEDWRIDRLSVCKGVAGVDGGVRVRVLALDPHPGAGC